MFGNKIALFRVSAFLLAAIIGISGACFPSGARAQTIGSTYTYVSPTLPLWPPRTIPGPCPATVNVTTTVTLVAKSSTLPNCSSYYCTYEYIVTGSSYAGSLGTAGVSGGVNFPQGTQPGTIPLPKFFDLNGQNSSFSVDLAELENTVFTFKGDTLTCEYSINTGVSGATIGTWSLVSVGGATPPAQTFGNVSTPPVDPEDLPSSPVNPSPTAESTPVPDCNCGDPINTATGNVFETQADFTGSANTGIGLTRYYNSADTKALAFGMDWHSTWHRGLAVLGNSVTVTRADGRQDVFTNNGGVYTPSPDVTSVLTATSAGYRLVTADDSVETYSTAGRLLSVASRAGLTTTLAYNSINQLAQVTGPFGAVMSFSYGSNGDVATVTAPDGGVYRYAYDANGNLTSVTYPNGTVRRYQYGNTAFPHALTGLIDENGNLFASWTYDAQGRATSSQHAGGAELTTVSYGNNASTVTDANGNSHTYNLQTIYGVPKPVSLTGAPIPSIGGDAFTYDTYGFLASRTDYNGHVTTYINDARGNQLSRTEAYGTSAARTTSTVWHPQFHLPLQITEPMGRTTTYSYDSHGNILNKTVALGSQTRSWNYTYNNVGQVLTATDPDGHVASYTYDQSGNIASETDALGHRTYFTAYDGAGRLLSFTDPNGLVTNLAYDARGRLLSRAAGTEVTSFAYDAAGNLVKVIKPDSSFLTYVYDQAHRLTHVVDALGNQVAFALDGNDNRTNISLFDPKANLTQTRSFGYDWVNRLVRETGAQNQETGYTYDREGNLTGISDPLGHGTGFFYDALNQKIEARDAAGGVTQYGYDQLNRLIGMSDPRGLVTLYAYDGLDDQTGITSPDTGTSVKTYDAAGNVLTSTDARGQKTTYSYDALNRVTKALYADGTATVYQYDQGTNGIGHLTKMIDAASITSWIYDQHGRVVEKVQKTVNANASHHDDDRRRDGDRDRDDREGGITLVTRLAYDDFGRLSTITYPSGKIVDLSYDAAGHVNGLSKDDAWIVTDVAYRPFGPAASWREGNGAAFIRAFDTDGRITAIGLGATNTDPATQVINYTYDAASRITGMTATGQDAETYNYDSLNRLTAFLKGTTQATAYTYDTDGNRLSQTILGKDASKTTYAYAANSNHLLQTLTNSTFAANIAYDAAGNMVSDGIHTYAYDAKGRMQSVAANDNDRDSRHDRDEDRHDDRRATIYTVNGLGQRVEKQGDFGPSNSKNYVYDNAGHVLGEYDEHGRVIEETVWLGDLPVAVMESQGEDRDWDNRRDGDDNRDEHHDRDNHRGHDRLHHNDVFYIATDQLGAPRTITNLNGTHVWDWVHAPFGNTPALSISRGGELVGYDLRFPGQVFDEESGLFQNGFRDYSAQLGRYVESDPIGLAGGLNTYGYVGQNPLTRIDPQGKDYIGESLSALAEAPKGLISLAKDFYADPLGTLADLGPVLLGAFPPAGLAAGGICEAGTTATTSYGTLTASETAEIQAIASKFNTQIDVIGSRAAGMGRNIDNPALPIGKGVGTRSDIDFRINGQVDIDTRGALTDQLNQVGNGAGSVASSTGLPSQQPVITFKP